MKKMEGKLLKTGGSVHGSMPVLFLLSVFLQWPEGSFASANVRLESIEIFKSHEFFRHKPTVYFRCQGENKTYLPDVTETNNVYTFKGAESWQPLTALTGRKCKRCGLYEEDTLTPDDTFDEWELCPEDFSPAPEGRYKHSKEKEFNATFLCPECSASVEGSIGTTAKPRSPNSTASDKRSYKIKIGLVISLAIVIVLAIAIFLYRLWKNKRREEQQSRFLKLFEEDDDDLEIELGLRD